MVLQIQRKNIFKKKKQEWANENFLSGKSQGRKLVACLQPFEALEPTVYIAFVERDTLNCQVLYHATNPFLLGSCSARSFNIIIWLPSVFHTRRNTPVKSIHVFWFVTGIFLTVNQKIIKVLIHFSVVSPSVCKRSNHFCFNNKIKLLGTCVCYSVGGRDKYFCP